MCLVQQQGHFIDVKHPVTIIFSDRIPEVHQDQYKSKFGNVIVVTVILLYFIWLGGFLIFFMCEIYFTMFISFMPVIKQIVTSNTNPLQIFILYLGQFTAYGLINEVLHQATGILIQTYFLLSLF